MYDHRSQPPLTRVAFAARMLHHFLLAIGFRRLVLGWGNGWAGDLREGVSLHDAFLNAAMLLGGMGPTEPHPTTAGGKIFAGLYALYAGLFFLVIMGVLFAPVLHRLLHRFHSEESSSNAVRQKTKPPNK